MAKTNKVRKLLGFCCNCYEPPTTLMIYDIDGASKVERYCDSCLEKEKSKDYSQLY